MTVKEKTRLRTTDVTDKRIKAKMDLIVPVVNVSGRIVSNEHIHGRKCNQQALDFILIVKKMASWFVSPRTTKTTEDQTITKFFFKMQVKNRCGKGGGAVVIAFHSKDAGAQCLVRRLQNNLVSHITT